MAKGTFRKGINTKENILTTAKTLFYSSGLEKTSIKQICETAKVNTGTFSYYYGKKENLVKSIYEELLVKCYSYVSDKKEKPLNSVQKNTRAILIYYLSILHNSKTKNYHYEVLKNQSSTAYMSHNLTHIYKQFVADLSLEIKENELCSLNFSDGGSRRELVSKFIEDPRDQSVYDLVNTIHICMGRLFRIDEYLMKSYLFEAMEFERENDHSHIKFLI